MPLNRGELSIVYWPIGFGIVVVRPNEPFRSKLSTIPWPKWS